MPTNQRNTRSNSSRSSTAAPSGSNRTLVAASLAAVSQAESTAVRSASTWKVLERTPPTWKLDRKENTKLSLKYRRGKGEILIVSHTGRGWWDPTSDAKGDVFGLVQWLEPGLSFGHVRKRLREFAGLSPRFPPVDRAGGRNNPDRPVAERWAERKAVWPHSPTWRYLVRKRWLPHAIIEAASAAGVLREGPAGSAWFAHLEGHGVVMSGRRPLIKGFFRRCADRGCGHVFGLSRGEFDPLALMLSADRVSCSAGSRRRCAPSCWQALRRRA